jgi:solute carrier family 25 protein 38
MMIYPFDNIRVRMTVDRSKENPKVRAIFEEVLLKEGVVGFYRGYLPRILKKSISGAIQWTLYELLNRKNISNLRLE